MTPKGAGLSGKGDKTPWASATSPHHPGVSHLRSCISLPYAGRFRTQRALERVCGRRAGVEGGGGGFCASELCERFASLSPVMKFAPILNRLGETSSTSWVRALLICFKSCKNKSSHRMSRRIQSGVPCTQGTVPKGLALAAGDGGGVSRLPAGSSASLPSFLIGPFP